MQEVMGNIIAVIAVAGFGYFLYTRVKAAQARKEERAKNPPKGGGGGGGSNRPPTHQK